LDKKEYYVYALIDPRDDRYFYIGKGKGRRYSSHLKPKRLDFNYAKLERIKDIQKSGFEVEIEILFPSLDEDTAFELEKIVIYKLGREVFGEGILTNLNPGGKWKPGDSVFYSNPFTPKFDLDKLDIFSQQKFRQIPTISTFNYLNISEGEQLLYKYDTDGKLSQTITLNEFFSNGVKAHELNIVKAVREDNLPIYSRWIFSKHKFNKIYVSKYLPVAEFDIINEKFNKEFDEKHSKNECFQSTCIVKGIKRLEVEKMKDIVSVKSFYISGNQKSFKKTKNGRPYEMAFEWFENGNLSVKEELIDGYKDYIRTTFYESGAKHIRISRIGDKKTYARWFESGKIEVEFIENHGYVYYNEEGEVIRTDYRKK
tara:strand:- start:1068 stop:2177 length:1110 start_codon:yes stop_codon:yes gene_type:complete